MGSFRNVESQIALLESRGMQCAPAAAATLMREGYHAVISRYSQPFLMEGTTEPTYAKGTTFTELYGLFSFDRELRGALLPYLMRIETTVSSLVAYTFGERHQSPGAHLDPHSYTTEKTYLGHPDRLQGDIERMIDTLDRSSSEDRPIGEELPLWLAFENLTFGGVRRFYALMRRDEQEIVCERLSAIDESRPNISVRGLYYDLEVLVDARNVCAHNSRLYDARFSSQEDAGVADLVRICRRYLDAADEQVLVSRIGELTDTYSAVSPRVAAELRGVANAVSKR